MLYAQQQTLFFKLLFNVKLILNTGPKALALEHRPFLVRGGTEEGPAYSGANAPPVHGMKKCFGIRTD